MLVIPNEHFANQRNDTWPKSPIQSKHRNMRLDRENTPILILCLLQVADLISTRLAMRVPGTLELNPLVRELGLWQSKLTVLALVVILAFWVKHTKRVGAVWLVCGVYALIVASNIRLFVSHAGF